MYVGLMSGTSLDGIDAVLADFSCPNTLLRSCYQPYTPSIRERLLALHTPGENELDRAAQLGNDLSHAYAQTVIELLNQHGVAPEQIMAIGCHGQTVRHRPDLGYTLQLINGALLAELTDISVVCDFRSRDIACGGQGAPLVPAFHQAAFHSAKHYRVIVNIGGIANLTALPPTGETFGFDCGPGNLLMDAWIQRISGKDYDPDGAWARTGSVLPNLLEALLNHAYFKQQPPKSAGRETFHLSWLEPFLSGSELPADVQATLLALTVTSIARDIRTRCPGAQEIYLCGGGARNGTLVENLRAALPQMTVGLTDELGIDADWLEALAFAWLGQQTLSGKPGNLPSATGARGPRVLGAIYPA